MPARRFIIQGLVQGVGYRAFVERLAVRQGIRGEVWNRPDGAVEAFVEHESLDILQSFAQQLSLGPGTIEDISVSFEAEQGYESFEIGHSR